MSDKLKSYDALLKLEKLDFLSHASWPSSETEKKWSDLVLFFNSFSSEEYNNANVSNTKIKFLTKLFIQFLEAPKHPIEIFIVTGKRTLSQIITFSDRIKINNIKLCNDAKKIGLFLDKVPLEYYSQIFDSLMKLYLNTYETNSFLIDYIKKIYSKIEVSDNNDSYDLEVFFDQNLLIKKLTQKEALTYTEVLTKCLIKDKFQNTLYFNSMYFNWIFNVKKYTYDFIQSNYSSISLLTEDEKKLLFAKIINVVFTNNSIKNSDELIRSIEENFFENKDIKFEKEYWSLKNEIYKTEENELLLQNAFILYKNIFTRLLITTFFNLIKDNAKDYSGQDRASFWTRYSNSTSFNEVKLVLTSHDRYSIFKNLKDNEKVFFRKHCLDNLSTNLNEPPVFIMIFDSKIIVEFAQNNNALQFFNSDNPNITNLIHRSSVPSSQVFKINKNNIGKYSGYGEGRLTHNSNWRINISMILNANGIYPGTK